MPSIKTVDKNGGLFLVSEDSHAYEYRIETESQISLPRRLVFLFPIDTTVGCQDEATVVMNE